MSAEERAIRVDLAAACRLVAYLKWDEMASTQFSARIPSADGHMLIKPRDAMFDEVTASSLVRVDASGLAADHPSTYVDSTGFSMHRAIYAARDQVACVMHTLTVDGVAVSAQRCGLLPISQHSIFVLQTLAYHEDGAAAPREPRAARIAASLAANSCLMLRNQGLLTCGSTVAEAFQWIYMFEAACRMQVRARSGTDALITIAQSIIDTAGEQSRIGQNGMSADQLIWPGLLRRLDRLDSSYRE